MQGYTPFTCLAFDSVSFLHAYHLVAVENVQRIQCQLNLAHHIHGVLSDFVNQHISESESDSVFAGDGAFEVHGSSLYKSDDLLGSVFLATGAHNDGMVIACLPRLSHPLALIPDGTLRRETNRHPHGLKWSLQARLR